MDGDDDETQAGSPGLMCPLDASYSQSSSSFGIDTPKDTAAGSMAARTESSK